MQLTLEQKNTFVLVSLVLERFKKDTTLKTHQKAYLDTFATVTCDRTITAQGRGLANNHLERLMSTVAFKKPFEVVSSVTLVQCHTLAPPHTFLKITGQNVNVKSGAAGNIWC